MVKHIKLLLCSIVITIVSLIGIDLYYQSDFHLNNELKKKITFETESAIFQNLSLNEEENLEYEITGSNIMIELSSNFDSYSIRDMYINSGETDYDFILSKIRSEAKSYYTRLRSQFASKYQLDIYEDFSSPFINIHSDKVLEEVDDLDNNLKEAIIDSDVICSLVGKEMFYKRIDGSGGGEGDPYPDQETPTGLLGKKEVLEKVNATNTGYNGSGINIGILEARDDYGKLGQPDTSYLYGLNVSKRETLSQTSVHATAVTKCVSWLAPEANYYCSSLVSNSEYMQEAALDWMLEKKVNVINMSFGVAKYGLFYQSVQGYYDKFVKDNFITMVASAGNSGTLVGAPAICKNVIAVGATNFECTDRSYFSSYQVPYNIAKPNIMAPGTDIFFGGSIKFYRRKDGQYYPHANGTSFSAPIVTGAVAQLMQKKSILKLYPEAVQAVLYNTANQRMLASYDTYAGFDSRNGAGMLDVKNALDNIFNYNVRKLTTNDNNGKTITMANVSVESGHTLNVNLHWLSNSLENDSYDPKEDSPYINQMTNFDLYVYNSAGAIVSITHSNNNSELARIPITESGDYHICLYQYGSIVNPTEHIALAWSII